ncbi:MAG TPA: peptidylprolyl isomerase [Patescibacteria group bacterium]|nr:peptidylprolyl isomerase [Patescibacteria group bacterium]
MVKVLIISMIILAGIFTAIALFAHNSKTSPLDQNTNILSQPQTTSQATPTSATSPIPTSTPVDLTTLPRISANAATIHTAKGDIVIQLYPNDAPKTVINFATLAKAGYYNGLIFHRVVPGFVIQGGDPNGNGTGGESIYGPTFDDELNASASSYQRGYLEGIVAMANRGPNTNSSQFFIMLADNPNLPHAYTIFGKVIQGMDVVKKIQVGDKMLQVMVQ